jgi:putative two-component system response regulator
MPENKPLVLIVDDQPVNLTVLGELLEEHCRVRVADSGERALRAAANTPAPDLILLDVMMPGMDGYEVLKHLKSNPATRDIPVMFVTALDADVDEERGLELGAADYLHKPIKPLIVLARVRTQLEVKRARDWLKNQNKFLEDEIVRRMRDNEIVQNASLASLAILAETRDSDTGNHIHRTQRYVEVLIRELKMQPGYAEALQGEHATRIVKAAPLHDIGKVGIPDHILRKPGTFDAAEFQIMQQHSHIGGQAIDLAMQRVRGTKASPAEVAESPLAFLEVARQIALWHHERWDGQGYPHGLKRDEIPLPARIMAVADVFDALITSRVYKPAYPVEEAILMIAQEHGKHFDPNIVEAFMRVKEDIEAIARELA